MARGLGKDGFILLEVLLVVVILSGALVMVINALMMSARASASNEKHFLEVLDLENKRFQLWTAGEYE